MDVLATHALNTEQWLRARINVDTLDLISSSSPVYTMTRTQHGNTLMVAAYPHLSARSCIALTLGMKQLRSVVLDSRCPGD